MLLELALAIQYYCLWYSDMMCVCSVILFLHTSGSDANKSDAGIVVVVFRVMTVDRCQ